MCPSDQRATAFRDILKTPFPKTFMNRKSIFPVFAVGAMLASLSSTATSQATALPTTQAAALPPAAGLLAKYGAAVGAPALLKSVAVTTKGGLSMPAAGMEATFEMLQLAPSRMRMTTNIPGMGPIQVGYDGTIGWSMDPMQGPRLLAGKEFDQIRDEADPRTVARSAEMLSAMQTVADTTMGGERCYLVKLNWKSGRETFDCFSPISGFMVGSKSVQQTAMGAVPVVTHYSAYKKFGELTMPTKTVLEVMGQQQILNITSVEVGTGAGLEIKAPPEIQALIKPKT